VKVFWFFFSKKNRFLSFAIGALVDDAEGAL